MKKIIVLGACLIAPLIASAQTILIDFGAIPTGTQAETWNDIKSPENDYVGILSSDLVDTTNQSTGITLEVTNGFNGENAKGYLGTSAPVPSTVSQDSFYVANENWDASPGDGIGIFKLSGLDTSKSYSFTFFASRAGATDNRESLYTVTGANSGTATLDAANNVSATVSVVSITPTAEGTIEIQLGAGANNNNNEGFAYINSVEITAIPEPATSALFFGLIAGGAILLIRRRRHSLA